MTHSCNPSYSGDRDREDRGSKPARANSSQDPVSKRTQRKTGLVEWLRVQALSSSPGTTKKRKEKKKPLQYVNLLKARMLLT
jgi:hypothetical protein